MKPEYSMEWFDSLCKKIKTDKIYDLRSLGTLGGGNHFIEVNRSEETNLEYLTVHSGSRNLGQKVFKYHQDIIFNGRNIDWDEFDDKVKKFKRNCKNKKDIKKYQDELRKELFSNRHPDYLIDDEAINYYFDMIFCQKYALVNREIIIEYVLEYLGLEFEPIKKIESIHNYIDFNDFIIRKGAIRAQEGKKCIISLNMRDGILLCQGKGNEDWNLSSAHGAGRVLTRQQAQGKLSLKKFEKEMNDSGIYSTSVNKNTIDESPDCYKDTDLIKELIEPSVEILEQLKPILNIKG
jgi:RNA-splicing ligase RtcB